MKMKLNILIGSILIIILSGSCIKNEFEDDEKEEQRLIEEFVQNNGLTDNDRLESGVYVKITENSGSSVYAEDNDYVIVNYIGKYTDDKVFDSNIEEVAIASGFYIDTLVYGPTRLKVGSTQIEGFNEAIKYIPEGSSALMLIPSEKAQKDYIPLVFEVELFKVVTAIDTFEIEQMVDFLNEFEFGLTDTLTSGLFYRSDSSAVAPDAESVSSGDTLTLNITGKFAETENYIDGVDQRTFFPLGMQTGTIDDYVFGMPDVFPITTGVEMVIQTMKVGEVAEIVLHSNYGYGTGGYYNDILNIHIVPPYTPLYFTVELVDIIKAE